MSFARPLFQAQSIQEIDSILIEMLKDPIIIQAFSLSKTIYWNDLQRTLKKDSASISEFRTSLLRYIDRMCFRTSTYQAFSALSLPESEEISVQSFRRISDLLEEYDSLPVEQCHFRLNPSFWTDGTSMYIWSFRNKADLGRPIYDPKVYFCDVRTAAILMKLDSQSRTYDELYTYFKKWNFSSDENLRGTINDLISQEILVRAPGYIPCTRDPDIHRIRFNGKSLHAGTLSGTRGDQLFSQVFCPDKDTFPVAIEDLADAKDMIELLNFIEYEKWPAWIDLIKEDFLQQFPSTNVPFLEAINKLDLNTRKKEIDHDTQEEIEKFLFSLVEEGKQDTVVLGAGHLEQLKQLNRKLQIRREHSWSYMCLVVKDEEKGVWPKLILCGGANRFLGMYGLFSKSVSKDVQERWEREKKLISPAVFAEVLNKFDVPASDFSNRLSYADYDIPISAESELSPEQQLPLSDLRLSCVENRFILHSEKLGREVIPLASHKLVSAVAHPVERFLLNIGVQNQIAGMNWGWERMIRRDYYPRVVYKGIVLSPRKWAISSAFLKKHLQRKDLSDFLFDRFGIEKHVQHVDHDRPTAINFSSPASIIVLSKLCENFERLIFAEEFGGRIEGKDGHVHEFLVPLEGKAPKSLKPVFPLGDEYSPEPVSHVLGLHLQIDQKWYGLVLSEVLPQVLQRLIADVKPSHWFYLMYTTQESEVRIRLFNVSPDKIGAAIDLFSQEVEKKISHIKKTIDVVPYTRSRRHYGNPRGNEIYERLSHHDSEATLVFQRLNFHLTSAPILSNSAEMKFERETLWFLLSAQAYLKEFVKLGLSDDELDSILRHRQYQWKNSASAGTSFSDIHRYFRDNRELLLALLFENKHADNDFLKQTLLTLEQRSEKDTSLIQEVYAGRVAENPVKNLTHYIFRLIHMSKVRTSLKLNLEVESLILDLLADLHKQKRLKRGSYSKSES